MFINEFVNLKCLLTWFSNFLPMLLRCCGIRKTERDFSHFCLSPSSSSPRACETHRTASAASVKNNHSERRMLKSWFHVCRQKEQRASEAAKKNWCRHTPSDIMAVSWGLCPGETESIFSPFRWFLIIATRFFSRLPHCCDCSFSVCWCKCLCIVFPPKEKNTKNLVCVRTKKKGIQTASRAQSSIKYSCKMLPSTKELFISSLLPNVNWLSFKLWCRILCDGEKKKAKSFRWIFTLN